MVRVERRKKLATLSMVLGIGFLCASVFSCLVAVVVGSDEALAAKPYGVIAMLLGVLGLAGIVGGLVASILSRLGGPPSVVTRGLEDP